MKHITSKLQVTNDNVANVIFVDQKNALTKELNSLVSERAVIIDKDKSRFLEFIKEEHSKIKIPKKLLEAANTLVKHTEGKDVEVVPMSFSDIEDHHQYLYNRAIVFPHSEHTGGKFSKPKNGEIAIQVKIGLKLESTELDEDGEEAVFGQDVLCYFGNIIFKRPKTIYVCEDYSKIKVLTDRIDKIKEILSKEDALKLEIEAFVTRKAIHDNPEYEGLNLEEFKPLLLS